MKKILSTLLIWGVGIGSFYITLPAQAKFLWEKEESFSFQLKQQMPYEPNISIALDYLYSSDKAVVSTVYPNPASDYIFLDYNIIDANAQAKILVFDVLGNMVGQFDLNKEGRKIKVATHEWAEGIYFYTFSMNGKNLTTKKLIVRR